MLSLALLGAAAVASAEPLAVRRLQSDSSCTGRHRSESETCEREFLANKGQGQGFRADCVGLAGSATEHCIYEPANLIDQCGLLAHQRPGDTPEEKCEAARGCAFEEGACVRNTKIPLSGMCAGNTHTSRDYQCPGLLVLKTQASVLCGDASEGRFLAAAREGGAHRHANTPPQPPPNSPAATRKPQRRTTCSDRTPLQAHTAREQAPCVPAAQVSAASPAATRR